MFKYLHDRGWLRDLKISAADLPRVAQAYFVTCLKPPLGNRLERRSEREMTSMADALGHILRGEEEKGSEVLMQRFKALEAHAYSNDWEEASQYELVPGELVSCVSLREKELARASLAGAQAGIRPRVRFGRRSAAPVVARATRGACDVAWNACAGATLYRQGEVKREATSHEG